MTTTTQPATTSSYRGIMFMILAISVFSMQDGVTRVLAEHYHPILIVMIRYWAFAVFVLALSAMRTGGIVGSMRTAHPIVQMTRGLMLAYQICVVTWCFNMLGLAATHALLAASPLMIAAAGAVILGERVNVLQWAAVIAGFAGVLILVAPDAGAIDPIALVPLFCAAAFATYSVLTRWVSRRDQPQTSFFYTGMGGAIGMTILGPFFWTPMSPEHWGWMAALCVMGATGHFLLIKAYECAPASSLQPFAYLQLAATSALGVTFFGETVDTGFFLGTGIIVTAGLFALHAARWNR